MCNYGKRNNRSNRSNITTQSNNRVQVKPIKIKRVSFNKSNVNVVKKKNKGISDFKNLKVVRLNKR